ncbi:MAG: hypothetical protein IT341_05725 [Chloroflexi bacterium]|nr:hypothetical protein [Chloroflexota bacterium]
MAFALAIVGASARPDIGAGRVGSHTPIPEPPVIQFAAPPPPRDAGPAVATIHEELANRAPFEGEPRVHAMSDATAAALSGEGVKVIENREGLVVIEVAYDGERVRIAAMPEHTDAGTDVVGIAFLDESEIAELEGMGDEASSVVGPAIASAHFKDQSHYHYFYDCSYIYNQGGTYGMSWYMCPQDTEYDRLLGYVISSVLSIPVGSGALLRWLGGMLVGAANEFYFYESDGSLRGSISDFRNMCGWVMWNSGPNPNGSWMYYYCQGSANFGKGWNDLYDKIFYVKYP